MMDEEGDGTNEYIAMVVIVETMGKMIKAEKPLFPEYLSEPGLW